ncbi:c-type heme family protein [Hymenobacter sp. B1770]|uniref:c-type heme family protein n=1 Tax=Hymenobacter sp. B1770 TaxID=1718788 RepID=UPI003CF39FC7
MFNSIFRPLPASGAAKRAATHFCLVAAAALAATACRPDQVEHLKDTKRIGIETANWEVKRIMPKDLLKATRWAGDSLTATADTLLRRTLARELAAGGVTQAAAFCRPETYRIVDSLAGAMKATPRRVSARPRNPEHRATLAAEQLRTDTTRTITRESQEVFFYQRPIVLNNALCLRCHGEVGKDVAAAEYAFLKKQFPQDEVTGYRLGQQMGAWQVSLRRDGVAGFWTMKTRKKWKPHKF